MVKDASDKPEEKKILRAILNAKKKFGPLLKDKNNPFYKSKYSDLPALMDVVEGPLLEEDVVILQPTIVKPEGQYVRTRLVHISGEEESGELELPKNLDAQKTVAAITYYKRATLQALLAIPARDDDGETAHGRGDYDPNHPTAPHKPAPASFSPDPREQKKIEKKAEEKKAPVQLPASPNAGLANVVVQSISADKVNGVDCSRLKTSGGDFIVDVRKATAKDILKVANESSQSKANVIIDFFTTDAGNSVVKTLRAEG